MSQTRSEVLSLLKQFDQEFKIFDGAEESFILSLLQDSSNRGDAKNLDWQRLSKAAFVLPHCHIESRKQTITDVPAWFLKQAKASYLHQVSTNESRIEQIQELARLFAEAEIKVLFL